MTHRHLRPSRAGSQRTRGAACVGLLTLAACAAPAADATRTLRQPAEFEPQDAV
ncbi:MAG: hypothetical protein H6825_02015 [Planctomycetes bacterium]|nr:hypothetical protein [Planctomycetota bacterium]